MNAEIKEFPGWHCTACGHSGESRHSRPVKCPQCGEQKTQGFYGPVPTHPRVQSHVGSHDLCHPSDKQWVLEFIGMDGYPGGKRATVMFDADSAFDTDGMTILQVAERALATNGGWSSKRQVLPPLIEWLKANRAAHDIAQAEFRAEKSAHELWLAYHAARDAESDLDQLNADQEEAAAGAVA